MEIDWNTLSIYAALAGLLLACAVGVVLVAFQLPGTWLIVLLTGLAAWWQPARISLWTLVALIVLALLAELAEFATGALGARRAGGSKRGAILAIIGAGAGALAGTVLIPVPILGTIVGACVGSGLGAMFGDGWAGRTWTQARATGSGAVWGRLWGTLIKLGIAVIMWLLVALAVFWP